MKKLFLAAVLLGVSGVAFARSLTVDTTQTGSLNCGPNPTTPTVLFTGDPAATRTYIVNSSTNVVYLGFQSTTSTATPTAFSISTSTGNFYLVAGSTYTFSPDGPVDIFTGPMWCVGGGNGAVVQRIRMH